MYVAIEVDDIREATDAMRALNFGGGTITKPFKQEVMQYLDEIDDDARAIGAVNVVVNNDGKLTGRNSDWVGASGALKAAVDPAGKHVALLGAGPAARAVAFGIRSLGAETTVFNRTESKAQSLCATFGCKYGGSLEDVSPTFDIIINATSIGLGVDDGPSPIAADALKNQPLVFDIIPRPKETGLLKVAAAQGCQIICGVDMIAYLAGPTLEWLTGARTPQEFFASHFS